MICPMESELGIALQYLFLAVKEQLCVWHSGSFASAVEITFMDDSEISISTFGCSRFYTRPQMSEALPRIWTSVVLRRLSGIGLFHV